ncbi:hypothetical protein CFC21_011487 [Triticum aestivum]|uniref:FBD domain-containing protein n=2 Tax=Triticum aestivum TaxID=4565 RepID=A0A9R1DN98_WHEAT|nr:hypothetical protein CFC21_011487 [Triticum aestivum]
MAAMFRRLGLDPAEVEGFLARVLSYTHYALPEPPVTADARLFALLPGDSVDRVSRLPDALLGYIVSPIPIKDAARTVALSRRWRGVWRSAPLVIVDTHIHPAGIAYAQLVTCAVSHVLAAHPGPFAASPVLETMCLEGEMFEHCIRLVNQSLWRVQIIGCWVEEIFVVDAPCLERLIQSGGWSPEDHDGNRTKVMIGHAPKLHMLGYLELDPGHVLEVGNTIIKAGTRVSPSTMVPSMGILALEVRFRVRNDAKMVPNVLRVHSVAHQAASFHDFRGGRAELAFVKYFFESALVLKKVVILFTVGFSSMKEAQSKLSSLGSVKRASETSTVLVNVPSDPQVGSIRSFKIGSGFSADDPFANY